jgi:hypothetical protein
MEAIPANVVLIKQMAKITEMLPFCFADDIEIDAVITSGVFTVSVFINEQDYFFSNDRSLSATACIRILSVLFQEHDKIRDQLALQ